MQETESADEQRKTTELVTVNVIRVETALSRYPVHRLAKQGTVSIEIQEKNEHGEMLLQWEVSHNSRYGQPGPLAYKIDTLIVNRRIEEASRPIPTIIKLGSIHEICRELGVRGGKSRANVKNALYQNAFVGIKAKCRYKLADGRIKILEKAFTRYGIVFTGEEFPDGRRADAVYAVLNEDFRQVINGAQTRPLDYDYLKDLPPASQRLYELLSFHVYATLKHGRREGRLSYSEFCTYAPLTRFYNWDQVRPQMARLHRPHLKSDYIESVKFEQSTDKEGKPDWLIIYVPGTKARAEYRAFTRRGGTKFVEIEQAIPTRVSLHQTNPTPLELELVNRGVTASTARQLLIEHAEETIADKVEYFDWMKLKHPKKVAENPGGFLVSAIRENYAPLKGFETKLVREKRQEAAEIKLRNEHTAAHERDVQRTLEQNYNLKVKEYWEALTPDQQQSLETEAGLSMEPIRSRDTMARLKRTVIRDAHIRAILKFPSEVTSDS